MIGSHATVGRLSNNVFCTFQAISKTFEKVAERSSDSGRRSSDRLPTVKQRFLDVLSNLENFGRKVTERSRDSGRRSRDRRPTVKQRFLDVWNNWENFWKKSLNGHPTVVRGHATVCRLSNNVFWTFQAIRRIFEKKSLNGHATVVGGHATVGRLSNNVFWTFETI